MRIDLEEGELEDLREAVQGCVKELVTELARADQREYRAMLRKKCDRFERLNVRLERAATVTEPAHAGGAR
jgi:hypothetical protein